jgi:hypothetical protein
MHHLPLFVHHYFLFLKVGGEGKGRDRAKDALLGERSTRKGGGEKEGELLVLGG